MLDIKVMNIRMDRPSKPYDFRVDRRTPLGNPFVMSSEKERDMVCDKFEENFQNMLVTDKQANNYFISMMETYKRYGKLRLFCHCAPKRCHAETIKKELEVYLT